MNAEKIAQIRTALDQEVCVPHFLEFLRVRHGIEARTEKEAQSLIRIGAHLFQEQLQKQTQKQASREEWLTDLADALTSKQAGQKQARNQEVSSLTEQLANQPGFHDLIQQLIEASQ